MTATATVDADAVTRFVKAAHAARCPADQVMNFLKAGVVLHPKQLLASAAARECDKPDGPIYVGFGGARGGGKALALDTPLPTPSGWTTMGAVQVGDQLLGATGQPCNVTAVSDVMHGHVLYDVTLKSEGKGTTSVIRADAGHLWTTFSASPGSDWRHDEVSTTEQIRDTLGFRHFTKGPNQRHGRYYDYHQFVEIVTAPTEPVKCVTVDSDDHLYLAGESFVATHNSHWMVAQIGIDDCQRVPGLKCLILRKIAKSAKEGFGDLARRIFHCTPYSWKDRDGLLTFPNDSRIYIGNFKDENDIDDYLGLEYDVIGLEEATTLSQRKITNIDSCKRTSKPNFRPRMYSTTNPGGISHSYFKKTFILPWRAKKEGDTRFVPSLAKDNPSLNDEYVTKTLAQYTGWVKRAWVEGDWDIEAGQYFTNFHYETHVRPRKDFDLPTTWTVWCGFDHGLVHYTVCHLLAKDGDGNIWVLDEHAERMWLPEQHAAGIKAMLLRWEIPLAKIESFEAGHDCFSRRVKDEEIGTYADDYRKYGIILSRANIDRVNGAKEIYRRLGNPFPEVAGDPSILVQPSLFILDSCGMLINCLPSLQHSDKNPEDVMKVDCDPDTGEGGDDAYDAARYGICKYAHSSQRHGTGATLAGPRRDFAEYRPR